METGIVEESREVITNLKQEFYAAKPSILKAFFQLHFREVVDLSKLEIRKTKYVFIISWFLLKMFTQQILFTGKI